MLTAIRRQEATRRRDFLPNATESYELIAYGILDTQGLLRVMSNLR
jgi:hypothetical protein